MYAGGPSGLYKSLDGGATWNYSGASFLADGWGVQSLAVDPSAPMTIYAGLGNGTAGYVAKSTDGGATWAETSIVNRSTNGPVTSVAVGPGSPGRLYAGALSQMTGTINLVESGGGLFVSTNGGSTRFGTGVGEGWSIRDIEVDPSCFGDGVCTRAAVPGFL